MRTGNWGVRQPDKRLGRLQLTTITSRANNPTPFVLQKPELTPGTHEPWIWTYLAIRRPSSWFRFFRMIKPLDSYHHVPHAPLPHALDFTNIREVQVLCWVGHENRTITDLSNKKKNLNMHIWLAKNTKPWLWLVRWRCKSFMSQW